MCPEPYLFIFDWCRPVAAARMLRSALLVVPVRRQPASKTRNEGPTESRPWSVVRGNRPPGSGLLPRTTDHGPLQRRLERTPLMRSRRGFITLLEFLPSPRWPRCRRRSRCRRERPRARRLSAPPVAITCVRWASVCWGFHDQQAVFPSSGGYAGDPIYLVQYDIRDGPDAGQRIGIGYPDRVPEEQTGSWVYAIRPCLDRRANADAGPSGGRDIALPMLLCPAR